MRTLAIGLVALGGTALTGSAMSAPASAVVKVSIPPPGFYGAYRIHTGPCTSPQFAFNHPERCGYPRYNEPVFVDGLWVNKPLYYRLFRGHRYFWQRGRWVVGHGRWDGHIFRGEWQRVWRERGWDRLSEERREHHPEEWQDRDREYDHDERSDENDNADDKYRDNALAPPDSR